MKPENSNRLLALEGLRGIAAIAVVIYHTLLIFWCYLVFGPIASNGVQNMRLEDNLYATPVFSLYSGAFAVAIFFVLSGFVLSIGFFTTGKIIIIQKLAAKRYLRLMIPALVSIMIAWLLLTLKFSHNSQAFAFTQSSWLATQWDFIPNFFGAIWQGMWGIFTTGEVYYNPVLWTMLFEFAGSFLVFLVLALFGKFQKRWIIYIFLIVLTFKTWYLAFIIGMVLADLYAQRKFPFNGTSPKFMGLILLLGIFFGGFPVFGPTESSIYNTLKIVGLSDSQNLSIYTTLGALLVVVGVLAVPVVSKFFSSKFISGLGKYTFSLYLVHKLVLFSLTTGLFVWFMSFMYFNQAALLSITLSIPVILVATYLFERFVDSPSIKVSGIFANWLLGLPQKTGTDAYSKTRKNNILKVIYKILKKMLNSSSEQKT